MRFLVAIVTSVSAFSCLDNAVPVAQRRNLTNAQGESYPVGMWSGSWASAKLTSAMVKILIEEVLGFNVRTAEGADTSTQMWAITGCQQPANAQDQGCGDEQTYWHIGVECWVEGYAELWATIQRDFTATAPVNLGNMGYDGIAGQYILSETINRALEAPGGLSLEYYGNYNASRYNPEQHFDSIAAINTSDLRPCTEVSDSIFFRSSFMQIYADFTGDWQGVEMVNGSLRGKCFEGYYWFAPSCRLDSSRCLPFLTCFGYEFDMMMQRATSFDMPIAIADVKDWDTYQLLPEKIRGLFYWFEPDPTFLGLNAKTLLYPPFDRSSFERGIRISAGQGVSIDSIVSHDLDLLAPLVRELVDRFSLGLDVVKQLLLDQKVNDRFAVEAACSWLKGNRGTWEKWLPDNTRCYPQFGLFNQVTETFQDNREDDAGNVVCKACGSGSFSDTLRDNKGLTYICRPCSAGYAQPSGASSECQPCPQGEYQEESGASSCIRCTIGTYQNITGQSHCKRCPADRTTFGLGSQSLAGCVCIAGLIEADGKCLPCPEGVACPTGSTVAGLLTATVPLANSSDAVVPHPFLLPGYTSGPAAPLTTYKCREEHCPGGAPGTCSAGRIGITCAECPAQSYPNGENCIPCGEGRHVPWLIGGGFFFVLIIFPSYYAVTQPYDAKTRTSHVIASLLGLFLNIWQNLVVVSGAPTTWPALMTSLTESLSFMSLNVEALGISCLLSGGVVSSYSSKAATFPVVVGMLLVIFALTRTLPKLSACRFPTAPLTAAWARMASILRIPSIPPRIFRWSWHGTLCLIGKFCQVTFPTMANVGLTPMMCYEHPGGAVQSLMKYSNTICWTQDHVFMGVAGILLLVFTVGFLGLSIWASWIAPRLSPEGQAAAKFLFEDFRPDMAWYGTVALFRGLFLSLPSVFVPNRPNVQLVLLHSTMLISLVFQGYCQPWKAPALNLVDAVSQSLFLTLLGIGLAGLEQNEDAKLVFEALGAFVCVCLLVVCGLAIAIFTLALALEKLANRREMGRRCANVGDAPVPEVLVFLLRNVASSIQQNLSHADFMVAALDRLGSHDARLILMALTILETEVGLSTAAGSIIFQSDDKSAMAMLHKFSDPKRISPTRGESAVSRRQAARTAARRLSVLRTLSDIRSSESREDPLANEQVEDAEGNAGDPDLCGEELVSVYVK